jgi:hypothetical protein
MIVLVIDYKVPYNNVKFQQQQQQRLAIAGRQQQQQQQCSKAVIPELTLFCLF